MPCAVDVDSNVKQDILGYDVELRERYLSFSSHFRRIRYRAGVSR